jgi:phospholipase C
MVSCHELNIRPVRVNPRRYVSAIAGFEANHNAFAHGENNLWAIDNTPYSWGHFKRQDIPTHFALAEGWTVADMYSQGVVASTIPNRGMHRISVS